MFRLRGGGPIDAVTKLLTAMEANPETPTALFTILGHKADILLLHFRPSFDELNQIEIDLSRAGLSEIAEPTTSYVSVVELGLYESTLKTYGEMAGRGLSPGAEGWDEAMNETLERQRKAMAVRLYPSIPDAKYICFYPMDRKRGEVKNWYTVPMAERARMMHEHGLNGRRYAGKVKQIISGSIGFDDWEWGVDLFADDPLDFKRLIYEMRFDEVSADYALFGPFYLGVRRPAVDLPKLVRS
jgi:peroxiredoxin